MRKWKHPLPKFFTFFEKIICFIKIMCIFALSKDDNNRTTNLIFIHMETTFFYLNTFSKITGHRVNVYNTREEAEWAENAIHEIFGDDVKTSIMEA